MNSQFDEEGRPSDGDDGLKQAIRSDRPPTERDEAKQLRSQLMKMILDNEQARKAKTYFPIIRR